MEIVGSDPKDSVEPPNSAPNDPANPTKGLSRAASLNAAAAGLDFTARTVVELVLNPLLLSGLGML